MKQVNELTKVLMGGGGKSTGKQTKVQGIVKGTNRHERIKQQKSQKNRSGCNVLGSMLGVGVATEAEETCWSLRPSGRPPSLLILPAHLQPQADPLGDGRLGEGRLHHGQQLAGEGPPLRANQVALLLHA